MCTRLAAQVKPTETLQKARYSITICISGTPADKICRNKKVFLTKLRQEPSLKWCP